MHPFFCISPLLYPREENDPLNNISVCSQSFPLVYAIGHGVDTNDLFALFVEVFTQLMVELDNLLYVQAQR